MIYINYKKNNILDCFMFGGAFLKKIYKIKVVVNKKFQGVFIKLRER